jgi:sterol desaturase/sphingolipid hydroxylase (fatty acid hydroxylase superfamily)
VEYLFSREFRHFIGENNLFYPLLLLVRVILMTTLEVLWPARKVMYRKVILNDLGAFVVYQVIVFPLANLIDHSIVIRPHLPEAILAMPLALRFCCYLLIADLGHYWIHWLMHRKYVWRIHKWHHAPRYMYWLMGVRATLPQQVLVNLPYLFAYPFLDLSPWWMTAGIAAGHVIQNDWMHLNVTWRSNWLEWFVVTPRYHHIHHSDNPAYYTANLAALFTLWDRLFGTYVNPEKVPEEISFGLGEEVPTWRLIAGV